MHESSEKKKNEQEGLVISYFGNRVLVENAAGNIYLSILKRNQPLPAVGDVVHFSVADNQALITGIKPRFSQLIRKDKRDKIKVLAANLNSIAIVMAPLPLFSTYLIDRYLLAAFLLNIDAIIILNKIDLLKALQIELEKELAFYQKRYPVFRVSVYEKQGLQALLSYFANKTAVLVGPSGVGKSSIIAALNTGLSPKVGETSIKGAGKHTTTATRLYHLKEGGQLIDSPGVREFNLWPLNEKDIMHGYQEIDELKTHCKFKDCKHFKEPDCAVVKAVKAGEISEKRLSNYQLLMSEAKENIPSRERSR